MSLFFRNVTLFRFPACLRESFDSIEEQLAQCTLKPLGPLELTSRGFVSPFGRGESALHHHIADALLLTLGREAKVLPSAVIEAALADKLDQIEKTEGRHPGGRERKRIKDEIVFDLLPRLIAKPSRVYGYLDLATGFALVNTSSRKQSEDFVSALREALGSFPAVPASSDNSVRALLTAWIAGEPLPEGFVLGDECELRDPVDTGAVVKCRRQELEAEEVREHLKCGKQAFQVALVFEDRLSFVLGQDLVIRKLRFLEAVTESLEQDGRDSQRDEIDAVFALMSGELRVLLTRLELIFSIRLEGDEQAVVP